MTATTGASAPHVDPVTADSVLTARGLTAGFGGIAFIRDVDLQLAQGEILALLGANGAGKTTTLMALAGHLPPLAGHVALDGRILTSAMDERARNGFAMVTQERCVFMRLSVRDNLRLGHGGVDAALEYFPELKEHLNRTAGLLSGGQQQMLVVARVLASRPRVLLADEMSVGLAPLVVERLLRAIADAARDTGLAVVLVEQHLALAFEYADRAAIIQRGRLKLTGTTQELMARRSEILDLYL